MRTSKVAALVLGSVAIHALMSACSAGHSSNASKPRDVLDRVVDGFIDDPTNDAKAEPGALIVLEKGCDVVGPSGQRYARADFPGKSADELAGVVPLAHYSKPLPIADTDWPFINGSAGANVRDGSVLFLCAGNTDTPYYVDRVRFVVRE